MPRKVAVADNIYEDEAEGFILEHSLMGLPRTWPPVAPEPQSARLESTSKKMDWKEATNQPETDDTAEILLARKLNQEEEFDANKERCVICLMALRDRTIVGICGHEFCFECIGLWANQSRRCPLCSADMAPFLLHDLDARSPTKFYLPPLPQPRQLPSASLSSSSRRLEIEERWGERDQAEEGLAVQVARRREIYRHELYVKHIATNMTTRFRPTPTPRQFSEDPIQIQRATTFLRRELRVWSLIDVEFLTTYILSLLKAIDIRSEPAIRLLAEFLDTPNGPQYPHGAEHFAHELYTFLRSPYKDLRRYDEFIQYDLVPGTKRPRASSRLSSSFKSSSNSPTRSPPPPPKVRQPRRQNRRDTYQPSNSPTAKRWDERDTWLDPEYSNWLDDEANREKERFEHRQTRSSNQQKTNLNQEEIPKNSKPLELLPLSSPPIVPLRMFEPEPKHITETTEITIKGAAKSFDDLEKRKTLLERLAKVKKEMVGEIITPKIEPLSNFPVPVPSIGARAIVQARLKLRLKLQEEKQKSLFARTPIAQVLRPRTKSIEVENRLAELKRRLLVAKVLSAETAQERRERELRELLAARRGVGKRIKIEPGIETQGKGDQENRMYGESTLAVEDEGEWDGGELYDM